MELIIRMIMKRLLYIILCCSLFLSLSCEKGDDYYYGYETKEQLYNGTIYDYLMHQKGTYDSLAIVLERLPDLKERLDNPDSSLTFFAINNRSFALAIKNLNTARKSNNLPEIYLEDLDFLALDSITNRYIFPQELPVSNFEDFSDGKTIYSDKYNYSMQVLHTVLTSSGLVDGGQQQLTFSDRNNSNYIRYWNSTVTSNVDFKTKNGVIHTLSPRHEFGFGKFTTYLSK